MRTILTIIIALLLMSTSCRKELFPDDDELSIKRTDYTGHQLRIDGYYTLGKYTVYFFYRNGVILYGGSFPPNELAEQEAFFKSEKFNKQSQELKWSWGTFKIEGNKISFERWQPTQPYLKSYVEMGKIVNDTTFIITEFYRMQNGEKTEVKILNDTYHFKQFSPKPDSTNSFIN